MALGQAQRHVVARDLLANLPDAGIVDVGGIHQPFPGPRRVLAVLDSAQGRVGDALVGVEHVVKRDELEVLARDLQHPRGPAAVAPADELDIGVHGAHRSGEVDGSPGRGFTIEASAVVRRFVADLPKPHVVGLGTAVLEAQRIAGGVAVAYPVGRLFRSRGSHAALGIVLPVLAAIGLEVDAQQRFRPDPPAEIDELVRANLIGLDAAPE